MEIVVSLMFRNKKTKKNYKSFDDWASQARKAIDDFQKEVERELEEENNNKKVYEPSKKKTVYRKFSNNEDISEIFPRNSKYTKNKNQKSSNINKQSHEGNQSSKGSIEGSSLMEKEADPVNPDLRRGLAEKKAKARQQGRQDAYNKKASENISKQIKINKDRLKKKNELKRAILYSEIIGPPLSKRKNR